MTSGKFLLEKEHSSLMERLSYLSQRPDHFGRLFENVLKIFSYHHGREIETMVPLLEYMWHRNEYRLHDLFKLQKAWKEFQDEYESMISEHGQMKRLIGEIEDYPALEEDDVSRLVHELKRVIELEEEILYPAALVVGDLIQCREF